VLAITRRASREDDATLEGIGLPPGRRPCQSTLRWLQIACRNVDLIPGWRAGQVER
jgi:hypothetical protein